MANAIPLLFLCASLGACSASSSPSAPIVRVHIHHEPGGLFLITPTPIVCTDDGPNGPVPQTGPEVDDCLFQAQPGESTFFLQAHPEPAFEEWQITACSGEVTSWTDTSISFDPFKFGAGSGDCLVDVDLKFSAQPPPDGGTADGG